MLQFKRKHSINIFEVRGGEAKSTNGRISEPCSESAADGRYAINIIHPNSNTPLSIQTFPHYIVLMESEIDRM